MTNSARIAVIIGLTFTYIFGAAVSCLAADDSAIIFDCVYDEPATMKGYSAHIVADDNGIIVVQHDENNNTMRMHTTNETIRDVIRAKTQ